MLASAHCIKDESSPTIFPRTVKLAPEFRSISVNPYFCKLFLSALFYAKCDFCVSIFSLFAPLLHYFDRNSFQRVCRHIPNQPGKMAKDSEMAITSVYHRARGSVALY